MNFLKKFGQLVANIAGVVAGIGPIFAAAIPGKAGQAIQTGINDFEQVAGVVQTVETVFTTINGPDAKTGPEKLLAATPLVAQVILQSSALAGKKIADPTLFQSGCAKVAGGFADILNSIHPDAVQAVQVVKHTA